MVHRSAPPRLSKRRVLKGYLHVLQMAFFSAIQTIFAKSQEKPKNIKKKEKEDLITLAPTRVAPFTRAVRTRSGSLSGRLKGDVESWRAWRLED